MPAQHVFQPPTGTRDLYPAEAARRRFITETWRRVAVSHGFEEIDGPTFEHLDLYKVKSGEGIVSELFSFRREGGEKDYALRPEFTPTLARLYASKAASLPRPTKWFSVGPYFRAERPQRGRLREFLQLNCDVIGGEPSAEGRAQPDAECLACCIDLLRTLGLTSDQVHIRISDRFLLERVFDIRVVPLQVRPVLLTLLDARPKIEPDEFWARVAKHGLETETIKAVLRDLDAFKRIALKDLAAEEDPYWASSIPLIARQLAATDYIDWVCVDSGIVRGLAYYTGVVFEVVAENERAIAGGGRYDNLIELFGGPPTPAVGFGMGDVVLSLVLEEAGLMPDDAQLMGLVGQAPDAFVIAAASDAEPQIPRVLAALRRPALRSGHNPGVSHDRGGLHARRSYKTTKNVGKLLQDAVKSGARYAVIVESATVARLKDLTTGVQDDRPYTLEELVSELRRRLHQ